MLEDAMTKHRKKRAPRTVEALNPALLKAARRVSKMLTERGHAHALIGGLAVNAHGYARATSDVDFLVSSDAEAQLTGDSLGGTARGKTIRSEGVDVDLLFPREGEEFLEDAIRAASGATPVIPKGALVYMKLAVGRMKDTADVVQLLKLGKLAVPVVVAYLKKHRPDLVEDFKAMVEQAKYEVD